MRSRVQRCLVLVITTEGCPRPLSHALVQRGIGGISRNACTILRIRQTVPGPARALASSTSATSSSASSRSSTCRRSRQHALHTFVFRPLLLQPGAALDRARGIFRHRAPGLVGRGRIRRRRHHFISPAALVYCTDVSDYLR